MVSLIMISGGREPPEISDLTPWRICQTAILIWTRQDLDGRIRAVGVRWLSATPYRTPPLPWASSDPKEGFRTHLRSSLA